MIAENAIKADVQERAKEQGYQLIWHNERRKYMLVPISSGIGFTSEYTWWVSPWQVRRVPE